MKLTGLFLTLTLFLVAVGAIDPRWAPILALENVTTMTARKAEDGRMALLVSFEGRPEFRGCDNMPLDGVVFPATLRHLSLNYFKLQSIPEAFEFPNSISTLELAGNDLSGISTSIKWPAKLATLRLDGNKIQSIDSRITWPSSLKELDLSSNQLTTIPTTKWPAALTDLAMTGNPLVDVTSYAAWPPSLARLTLGRAKLTRYPRNLPRTLVYINLSNNPLKVFPVRSQLPDSILSLELVGANLTSLPTSISWPKLEQLRVGKNSITSIPEFWSLPPTLVVLELGSNGITKLPITSGWLTKLNYLDLSNNQLTRIEAGTVFPADVDLQNNKIKTLKHVNLPNAFRIAGNPLEVLSRVALPTNFPYWLTNTEIRLKEFTLTADNYRRFANPDNAFFYPTFTTAKASIEASCFMEYGTVTRYSDTISVCVV